MEKRETKRRDKRRKYLQAIDRLLVWVVFFVLAVIISIQAVMIIFPQAGLYLNTALRLEGTPLNTDEELLYTGGIVSAPWAVLSLKLVDYISLPEISVMIDGKEISNFTRSEVTLKVKHGDIVSIYNPNQKMPVTVIINKTTPNVLEPHVNSRITGSGTLFFEPVLIK